MNSDSKKILKKVLEKLQRNINSHHYRLNSLDLVSDSNLV